MAADLGDRQRDGALTLKRAEWYEIPHYWPSIRVNVEAALAGRSIIHTAEDLYAGCLKRVMTLWLALDGDEPKGVAIALVERHARATICVILVLAGEPMADWIDFEPDICAWAKGQGCDAIEAAGRKGWERRVADLGYKPAYVIYRKGLS